MDGDLFISIYGRSEAGPGRARRGGRAVLGSDPGGEYVVPDPDDPGGEYVVPDPDDPGGEYVVPDPDDPGGEYVVPDPDDPGGEYVVPDPDDPKRSGAAGARRLAPRYTVEAVHAARGACIPTCGCADGAAASQEVSRVARREDSGFVIVRLAADVHTLAFQNLYALAVELRLLALREVLELELPETEGGGEGRPPEAFAPPSSPGERRGRPEQRPGGREGERPGVPREPAGVQDEPDGVLRSAPLVDVPGLSRPDTLTAIRGLETEAQVTAFRPLHSLTQYWRVDLRPYPERIDEVVAAFARLQEVDVAYRELRALDPMQGSGHGDLSVDQGYLDEAPLGVGARWALKKLEDRPPSQLRIVDLEQGWVVDHEALAGAAVHSRLHYGDNRAANAAAELGQHGTAVLGQLAASQSLRGAVGGRASFSLASHYRGDDEGYPFPRTNGHVAAAIFNALHESEDRPSPLRRGDVLLLEVQRGRCPTEIDAADFDAIRLASARGVVVVEAAGNGNYDLDRVRDPADGRTFRRGDSRFRDSGAIFVGASLSSLPHDRAPFSNFGSRVDCYAWGEGVTTAGYGDLVGETPNDYYTNTFSGTSSAAPVIAGAAALVQDLHEANAGTRLRPQAMRALLSDPATGVRQGPGVGGHIGVMPDLRRVLGSGLGLAPDLYLRKRPADDGGSTGRHDDKSSSPDILVCRGGAAGLGEDGRSAHQPAPGEPLAPGSGRRLYVRVLNRGGEPAKAQVHLFASPAATLITSERWKPLRKTISGPVPRGDTLVVLPGIRWNAKSANLPPLPPPPPELVDTGWGPDPLYSVLAVLPPEDDPAGRVPLPPGPPYFHWGLFRAFLRRRGVAWRNAHRVRVTSGQPATLACFLAGTPDRGRWFDFEVVQRLPAGAAVTVAAPAAMAAKLHQRQPWLERRGSQIELPRRRSTRFSRVSLPASAYDPLWVRVEPGSGLTWGHSLAVRQLWQGEEVGRITWHFAE